MLSNCLTQSIFEECILQECEDGNKESKTGVREEFGIESKKESKITL
jgi:hypothetical protein